MLELMLGRLVLMLMLMLLMLLMLLLLWNKWSMYPECMMSMSVISKRRWRLRGKRLYYRMVRSCCL